jgi:hypothetical protein
MQLTCTPQLAQRAPGHNSWTAHTTHGQPHSVVTQLATRLIRQLAAQMGTQTAIRIASRVVSDTHTRLPPMQVMIIMSRNGQKRRNTKFPTRMTMESMTSRAANAAIYVESTRAAEVLHTRVATCSELLAGAGSQVGSRRSPCPAPQPRILPLAIELTNEQFF